MYKFCIIGCGLISESHANAISSIDNAELSAVCDINIEAAKSLASKYSCAAFSDAERMLDEIKPDAVIICVPTYFHYDYVKICADRGINVLCEKPMERYLDRAYLIKDAVKKSGIIYMTAQVVRFWSGYTWIKEKYDAGEFGDVRMAHLRRVSSRAGKYGEWLFQPDKGGGAMHDMLVHDVDFLRYLLGSFKQVYANAVKDETGCYNHVMANIEHTNGSHAVAEASFMVQTGYPFSFSVVLIGTKATVEYKYNAGATIADREGQFCELKVWYKDKESELIPVVPYDAYEAQLRYFVSCLESGAQPDLVPINQSVDVIQCIEAIHQSADDGRIHII